MALLVQKFGGSSVADAEKIMNVARRVAASAPGNQMIVVVSAMGKTTDGLLALSRQVSTSPDLREMDMLLSTGEQVTIALLHRPAGRHADRSLAYSGPHHADRRRSRSAGARRRRDRGRRRVPGTVG